MAEPKEEKKKPVVLVVPELPKQELRNAEDQGIAYEFMTINEALSEIIASLREIKKSLV